MSEPTSTDTGQEYDFGAPDYYAQAKADPGIPDEMVAEIEAESKAPIADINVELVGELAPMFGAVFVTIVVVELVKGLGLRGLLRGWERERRQTAYRWATAIVAAVRLSEIWTSW